MIARRVLPSDGLQAAFHFHGLGFGGGSEVGGSRTIYNMCALCLQLLNMLSDILGYHLALRNDEAFVARAGSRLQQTVFAGCGEQQTVGDVVAVETGSVDGQDALDELRCQTAHGVDAELHEQLAGVFLPHVANGQVDEEIVVGLAPLQETLTALDILHEVGGIAPDAVGGTHVDGGVELPARPRVVLRRIAGAVEEHVVDTGAEHEVDVGLQL